MLRRIFVSLGALALSFSCFGAVASIPISDTQSTVNRLGLKGDERILQYGGSDEEALALSKSLPQGEVIVITNRTTPHAPNIHTSSQLEPGQAVDFIMIEEELTKEYKQQSLLKALGHQLKPNGKMILHLPDYKQGIMARVMLDTWLDLEDFVHSAPKFMSYNVKQYQKMLHKSGLKVASGGWQVDSKEFANAQDLKRWLEDHWVYCQDMEHSEKVLFVSVFVDKYLKASEQKADGPVRLEQCYMSIEAQKYIA